MSNNLSYLPEEKQKEILDAVEIIKEEADPEKIILFGSQATGKWVDSSYVEDLIKLSYISDYDFLVALPDSNKQGRGHASMIVDFPELLGPTKTVRPLPESPFGILNNNSLF